MLGAAGRVLGPCHILGEPQGHRWDVRGSVTRGMWPHLFLPWCCWDLGTCL